MINKKDYSISQELRDLLVQKLGNLMKKNGLLEQSLREQQTQASADNEALLLELLEVGDALEAVIESLANNPSPELLQRLPRSIGAVHRKFLSVLGKRQVSLIKLEETQPDFNLCRVVDREVQPDLADQTIIKVLRSGFRYGEKILRPTEVITSKLE